MNGQEHARLVDELRTMVEGFADRAEPLLRKVSEHPGQLPATCQWCPVCAAIAVLRGDNPELAVRAAQHGISLLDLLRGVLAESTVDRPSSSSWTASGVLSEEDIAASDTAPPANSRVQRIAVRRAGQAWPQDEPDHERAPAEEPGKVERITIRRRSQET